MKVFNPKRHSVLAPSKLKCDPSRKCSIGTERDVSLCGVKEQVLHYETCFLPQGATECNDLIEKSYRYSKKVHTRRFPCVVICCYPKCDLWAASTTEAMNIQCAKAASREVVSIMRLSTLTGESCPVLEGSTMKATRNWWRWQCREINTKRKGKRFGNGVEQKEREIKWEPHGKWKTKGGIMGKWTLQIQGKQHVNYMGSRPRIPENSIWDDQETKWERNWDLIRL